MDARFVGAWELIATERRNAQGSLLGEALPGYRGLIIYSSEGYVSAQLMGPGRPSLTTADRANWTVNDRAAAFDTFIAYYGPFRVDEAAGVVIHSVQGAASPAMVCSDQVRVFRFEEDRLVLSPPHVEGGDQSLFIWRRCTRP